MLLSPQWNPCALHDFSVTTSGESALPPPGGPLAPQHAPRPSFSSTWQSLTQARTPIGDSLFGSQSPVRYLHQQPTTGAHNLQQLQGTLKGTHPQFAEEEGNQQPLAPLSQQERLLSQQLLLSSQQQRLLSQQQPVSSQQQPLLSQQQSLLTPQQPLLTQKQSLSSLPQQFGAHSRNHSPRTAQVLPYHALPDSTFAYPTCMAQRYPQLSMLEQQHQFLGNHPSVSLLQRMPSRYSHRSARSALPRRGKSCSNTFLCETIRGSNRALNIASLRRESQPACGRSRNCSLPRLPCVAGRLLLAGGRAVGEVGQAAVDVGSTVVKELANVLQRSVRNILDLEEDHPCVEKVEYDDEERQCIRSNSLCIPVTGVRARRFSQQKGFTYGSDPALGAGQTWQVTGCPTEEQLQHKLWMQEQVSRELQQQQQCGPHVEEYQHRGGSWRLPQQTHSQRSEWRSSRSLPPFFEDARERRSLEHSVRTEGPSPQAWDISKGESLGGLWLPRIHCQPGSPNQLELHSGAEANTAPQQVEVRPLEQEALDQQQLQWPGENQHGFENEGQFMRFHKLKQHEQVVGARLRKHAEFYDFANRHPENEQVLEEETSTAGSLAFRQGNLYQTLPHNWKCLERPQLRQLQEHSQDWTFVEGRTVKKDVPEFPNFLQWDENTPHSSMPESWAYSKQYALTGASEVRDYVEQEEARERLVRLAASATAVQSSNLATDQLTEDKAVPTGQSLACAPVCWADCGPVDHQGRSQLSDSCTISVNKMAFQQLDGNDTRSSNHNSAVALPSCDAKVGDSNADHLFWTGDPDSSTEFKEPRKGTSTFGRPELMSQYDGKQSALCLSDDGSNCSTRNSCKEDDRALRDVSVETLSPRFHSSKENSQKETPPPAIATHENLADGIALQQQAEAYTPRRQHQQRDDPHETATTRKEFDASSRLYGRAQQESYLSLHLQGIASSKQPVTRLSQPVHLSLGRTLHKRPENLPCKPYGAWVQDAVDTNAKLEARDRIVQRWKERTTRNLAESLAAGIRRR